MKHQIMLKMFNVYLNKSILLTLKTQQLKLSIFQTLKTLYEPWPTLSLHVYRLQHACSISGV